MALLSKGAADGFKGLSGDFFILPLVSSWHTHGFDRCGRIRNLTPISFLYVIDWLDYAHYKWNTFSPHSL